MTTKNNKRREVLRLPLSVARRGRKGYMCKTMFKLVRWASRRIMKLASVKRVEQYAATQLGICISSATGSTTRYPTPRKVRTRRWHPTIAKQNEEVSMHINFWHELSKMCIRRRVVDVCKSINRDIFCSAKYIGIEIDFKKAFIPRWSTEIDPAETRRVLDQLEENDQLDPELLYKPMDLFEDALFSTNYPKKIALVQSPIAVQKQPRSKAEPVARIFPPSSCASNGRFFPTPPDPKRLRQTKIEEHFKPRGQLTNKFDIPSKGA